MRPSKFSCEKLWRTLAKERPMTSLMEQEMLPIAEPFTRKTDNWVPMWVDFGHAVMCETGSARAVRAISERGELLWYVRQVGRKFGYHSDASCPVAAMEEARAASAQRRDIRQRWSEVRKLRRDVLAGRRRFAVTREDAYASPLCRMGVDGFMRRLGMDGVTTMSARLLAAISIFDEQVGFVLWQASERDRASTTVRVSPSGDDLTGVPGPT